MHTGLKLNSFKSLYSMYCLVILVPERSSVISALILSCPFGVSTVFQSLQLRFLGVDAL